MAKAIASASTIATINGRAAYCAISTDLGLDPGVNPQADTHAFELAVWS